MSKAQTIKKLDFRLSCERLPFNCGSCVVGEFCGGHRVFKDHPHPLTDDQWIALLGDIVVHDTFVFTVKTSQEKFNFSGKKLAEFVERSGGKITSNKKGKYILYTATLSGTVLRKIRNRDHQKYFEIPDPEYRYDFF